MGSVSPEVGVLGEINTLRVSSESRRGVALIQDKGEAVDDAQKQGRGKLRVRWWMDGKKTRFAEQRPIATRCELARSKERVEGFRTCVDTCETMAK